MSRFKVVVSDQVFPSVDLERRILAEIDADLVVASGTRDEVLEIARDADAILNTYLPFDADAIERLERCKIIARYGIGVDNIDLDAARRKGIVVTNVPDYCVEEVATHTLALILAVARKVVTADRLVRDGEWTIEPLRPLRRLSELTVGLLGYGKIARRVAAALETLGAEMVVYDPYVQPGPDTPRLVDLGELLSSSDILSIHAPLTPETRGMIDREALAKMKPGSYLVNTSRGPLVVLEDLLEALREGRLAGAALDVFENEPVNPEAIADVPNLIATPHMAYYSEEALEESQRKATTQVVKVLTGQEPDYRVA
ncbi:MAG: D-isomer specific 2-hydroxyacid dehydrogenase family protein [Acidimicrobiia bacterium]|nr:MAG: D-isomer specific 2-hydroxyacid dehydrogenase family protein [Acidimicrobiia bacterium]